MVVRDNIPALTQDAPRPELDPTKITVYSQRMSPYCQRVRLLLNVKDIPFQVVNLNIWKKPEWFITLTPPAKVPVIVDTDGKVHYESLDIASYLDEKYGQDKARLLPLDPNRREIHKGYIDQIMGLVGDPVRNVAMKATKGAGQELIQALEKVEDLLQDRQYFGGTTGDDRMGFVDLMVFPWFDRAPPYLKTVGMSFEDGRNGLPKLSQWRDRMLQNEAVAGSSYSSACYEAMLASRRSGQPTPDVGLDL